MGNPISTDDTPLTPAEVSRLADVFVARIGQRVREFRDMQGLTLLDLKTEHGINIGQLSRIERGKQNLTTKTAVRLAFALGVEPYQLYVPPEVADPHPPRRRRPCPSPAALAEATRAFRAQVGRRIKELRDLQGMSLMTLEGLTGMLGIDLRNIEEGKKNIRATTAIRLADAIGVYPHELYLPREQSGIRAKNPPSAQEETPHAKARPKSGTKARAKKAPSKTSGARARAKKQPRAKGRDA